TGLMEGDFIKLNHRSVSNIVGRGGTILKTARCPEFFKVSGQKKAVEQLKKHLIDALVVIGGDGSFRGAHKLSLHWNIQVVGIPGTIDNDLNGTDYTIGSDTAVNVALDAIDKIRDTATSLERIFIVEVMGRLSGYIALQVGIAGGAEEVIIPEERFNVGNICERIKEGRRKGKYSWIIIVAEGAVNSYDLAKVIKKRTGFDIRVSVLGYVQRGGSPTAFDRVLATSLGPAAVDAVLHGKSDIMMGISNGDIREIPFAIAVRKKAWLDKNLFGLIRILT
ncbi:MAG: 6-phosphofructokinase, partial [Candidatus Omnitrophica bacterium]|nr:6-phosphofructokinase [Candidatus Omnitrophota bacterium]